MAELFSLSLDLKTPDCKLQSLKSSSWAVWLSGCGFLSCPVQAFSEQRQSPQCSSCCHLCSEQGLETGKQSTVGNETHGNNPVKQSKCLLWFYSLTADPKVRATSICITRIDVRMLLRFLQFLILGAGASIWYLVLSQCSVLLLSVVQRGKNKQKKTKPKNYKKLCNAILQYHQYWPG